MKMIKWYAEDATGARLLLTMRLVAFALMACALLVIGCRNAPVTMVEEPPPPATPDPNAGVAWRLVRTGGGLESPSGTTGDHLLAVAWGAGRFVAVGLNGTIAHSTDGATWTEASVVTATEEHLVAVAWVIAVSSQSREKERSCKAPTV